MNRSCDTCYHYIMKSGVFPHLVCLMEDEHPDTIKEQMKSNGRRCPYWHRKVRIVGNTLVNRR